MCPDVRRSMGSFFEVSQLSDSKCEVYMNEDVGCACGARRGGAATSEIPRESETLCTTGVLHYVSPPCVASHGHAARHVLSMYTADHLRISHDRPATGNTQHPRAKETTPHPASSTPAHHDSDAQARTRPQALTYPRTVQRHSLSGGDLNPLGPGSWDLLRGSARRR